MVPTNALLMGLLALARIPDQRWPKFVGPLLLKLYLVAIVALIVAVWVGYEPAPEPPHVAGVSTR